MNLYIDLSSRTHTYTHTHPQTDRHTHSHTHKGYSDLNSEEKNRLNAANQNNPFPGEMWVCVCLFFNPYFLSATTSTFPFACDPSCLICQRVNSDIFLACAAFCPLTLLAVASCERSLFNKSRQDTSDVIYMSIR